jgi:hypothetical protein
MSIDKISTFRNGTSTGVQLATTSATPAGLLRRKDAAKTANMSVRSLRRLEGTELHPVIDEKGQYWYDPAEVARVAVRDGGDDVQHRAEQRNEGDTAAATFALLRAGKTPTQIVEVLALPPDIVRRLCEQWAELEGGYFFTAAERRAFEHEIGEPVKSPARAIVFARYLI